MSTFWGFRFSDRWLDVKPMIHLTRCLEGKKKTTSRHHCEWNPESWMHPVVSSSSSSPDPLYSDSESEHRCSNGVLMVGNGRPHWTTSVFLLIMLMNSSSYLSDQSWAQVWPMTVQSSSPSCQSPAELSCWEATGSGLCLWQVCASLSYGPLTRKCW